MHLPQHLILVLLFAATLFAGWMIGRPTENPDGVIEKDSLSSRQIEPHAEAYSLNQVRSKKTDRERIRSSIAMAQSLPTSEIAAWIRGNKFRLQGSYAQTVFRNILLERWSQEDPVAFLSWIGEKGSSEIAFPIADLFKNHPEAAGKALSRAKNSDEQSRIFSLLASTDPDQAISELRKILPIEVSRNPNFLISFISLVEKRPTELEALLNELPTEHAGPLAIAVFKHKLETNFDGTLDQLFDRPNGLDLLFARNFGSSSFEPEKLLARVPDFPDHWRAKLMREPWHFCDVLKKNEGALDLDWGGLGFSDTQAKFLRMTMFRDLVSEQPTEVLQRLALSDFSEKEKQGVLGSVNHHRITQEEVQKLSELLEDENTRAYFLRNFKEKPLSDGTLFLTPKQFFINPAEASGRELGLLHSSWKPEQKAEFSREFQSLEGDDKSRLSDLIVAVDRGWSSELKEAAIVHLLENDGDLQRSGKGENGNFLGSIVSQHAHTIMAVDAQKAARWVSDLPESQVRLETKINLAHNWRNLDPAAAQKWIESQPELERTAIEEGLGKR